MREATGVPYASRTEQATVNPDFSRVVAPMEWDSSLPKIDVASIARLQRMMGAYEMEVIGDTSPPLDHVLSVNRTGLESSFQIESDIDSKPAWGRSVILDDEDAAWEANFGVVADHAMTPEAGVDTGLTVNFSHTPPELNVFAELPQANAIKAMGRISTRMYDVNLDPTSYIEQFERWWGFGKGDISRFLNSTVIPISIPRLLAAGGKSASPIYGIENWSGLVRFLEPSVTRKSFVSERDEKHGIEKAVDFSYYRAAIRFVMCNAFQIPGAGQEFVRKNKDPIGFNLAPRAAVAVPRTAMEFAIPELDISGTAVPETIAEETKNAMQKAIDGRAAVIAGVALEDGELLLSEHTRARLGRIRKGDTHVASGASEIKQVARFGEVWHAQAGVGLIDFAINMLGSNDEHVKRNMSAMGRLAGLVEQKALNMSQQHCNLVSILWDPTFKNNFQRACLAQGSRMDDFISNAPESYAYNARLAYSIMSTRLNSVIRRIHTLDSTLKERLIPEHIGRPTIRDCKVIIAAWADFYAGKAKTAPPGFKRIRAQVLASYYALVEVDGAHVAFPDLDAFIAEVVAKYARRRKLDPLDFDDYADGGQLAIAADAAYNPEYRFSMLYKSLKTMSEWTAADIMQADPNPEVMDGILEEDEGEREATPEELEALEAFGEGMDLPSDDESLAVSNLKGPLKMRSLFYAICLNRGSEGDFIRTKTGLHYANFQEWADDSPDDWVEGFEEVANAYNESLSGVEVAEDGDDDVVDA